MNNTNTLIKEEVNKLFSSPGITLYELANRVGKSHSYLSRISSLEEKLPTPLEVVIPAMKTKNNFALLKAICWDCGFALVRLPSTELAKQDYVEMAAEYQQTTSKSSYNTIKFLINPSEENYNNCFDSLKKTIEESLAVKKCIEELPINFNLPKQ